MGAGSPAAKCAANSPLDDAIGGGYDHVRCPDARICAMIEAALGDARNVV
jgi:hypothetical protein